ncbi:ricin-type beta-trefoil lectin domain protein [Streptomyces sp. Act143]|uniref:RICIN domain-containing protein n=1 Tax=Streptomyces sp. Act143 TaxID=2200760 RepID=UPI000D6783CC|nr:RICIN domain-containing protein [Streptomyces sp. Act143]PWI15905.1 ricin-type beta-trefoil lectin domain protein [Streptomyces sp. Act143]
MAVHADASDARLTGLLRTDTATAYAALLELRARHREPGLAYARLCTTSESAARQLAAQVFTTAARETARGTDPGVPWRHRLLLLTVRSASSWAADDRAAGLDPGLLLILNTSAPGGPPPPMLAAFRSLPARAQGLVWYRLVEREPETRTAVLLGLTREDVVYGTEPALQSLAQACPRFRLAASDDPDCADFRRLIEESVRPGTPRDSADLRAHMALCVHCTAAYEELSALRDNPRTALAEGLLPWAGTAYVTRETAGERVGAPGSPRTWPRHRRVVLTSVALGVAVTPLVLLLMAQSSSPRGPQDTARTPAPVVPPPVTVTATATVSAAPTPSPTSRPPSPSPSPSRTARPTPSPSPSPVRPPGATYAQVVNVASGRCLDIRDGDLEQGTDVITAPCASSPTQRWRVDTGRGVLQSSADPDFCLDSRGSVDRGVGIWECGSVDGDNGDNLRFTVDPDGVIRPAIAIATALTPDDDGGLVLRPLTGGREQRWRAGAV